MALDDWFRANKLYTNTTKTFAMIFKGSRAPPGQLSVQINGIDIEMVSNAKFLGIIIDHTCPGDHISTMSKIKLQVEHMH